MEVVAILFGKTLLANLVGQHWETPLLLVLRLVRQRCRLQSVAEEVEESLAKQKFGTGLAHLGWHRYRQLGKVVEMAESEDQEMEMVVGMVGFVGQEMEMVEGRGNGIRSQQGLWQQKRRVKTS